MKSKKIIRKEKFNRGIAYIRVSSDDQVEGTSLESQQRQCAAVFAQQGLELVRTFRDEGATAKNANREALIEAVDFARNKRNRIDVLMVWKVDRFARNTEDHFAIRSILRAAGVELRSATEPIGDEPNAKLFETIVAAFAEFDNAIRALRCVNGMRARIRSGIWPFKAPVGYQNRSLKKQDLKKTEPDPIHPEIFPVLQRVLKGFARRAYTQTQMVEELERAGFEALTGIKPSLKLIDRLITKHLRFYAGWLKDSMGGDVEYHRGLHEPMITDEEMRAIEAIRDGAPRAGATHDFTTERFPLKGITRCEACSRPFTGGRSRGRSRYYLYYRCHNSRCPLRGSNVPKDLLERQFSTLLEALCPARQLIDALKVAIEARWQEDQGAFHAAARAHTDRLQALDARRAKVLELAESGAYTSPVARERIDAVEREIATAKLEAPEAGADELNPGEALDEASRVIDLMTRRAHGCRRPAPAVPTHRVSRGRSLLGHERVFEPENSADLRAR